MDSVTHIAPPDIEGIELLEEIGRGAHSVVLRGRRRDRDVAVKIQRSDRDDDADEQRFFRESALLASLDHAAFPDVHDVGTTDGRLYLVMEYLTGSTLAGVLEQGALAQQTAVDWALQLSEALETIHDRGLVHRDIKPENVLFEPGQQLHLIDFGLATRHRGNDRDDAKVGTFLYGAPEQVGALEHPIDGRADLYAVGVMLYESLAGDPPFEADDVGELLQQHAAVEPQPLHEISDNISVALSEIVSRCLAKAPADRYPTAGALAADLRQLVETKQPQLDGPSALIAPRNRPDHISDSGPLSGRDRQLQQLHDLWQQAGDGRGRIALIEGPAGSGKSRLAGAFLSQLIDDHQLVLTGRCPPQKARPFAALREAIESFLESASLLSTSEQDRLRQLLQRCAGESTYLLERFSTRLGAWLETEHRLDDDAVAQKQIYQAVADFAVRLASVPGRVVLFIDDAQWIDDASRQVLHRISEQITDTSLLIVATCRQGPGHRQLVDDLFDDSVTHLSVPPLTRSQIRYLVESYLGSDSIPDSLIERLVQHTEGSPFLVIEYLHSMMDAGILRPCWGQWEFDGDRIQKLQLSETGLGLVTRRLEQLGPEHRHFAQALAVLGREFDLRTASGILELDPASLHTALSDAISAHIMERRRANTYAFIHDRIRQTLLDEMSSQRRRALHQTVAHWLKDQGDDTSETLYRMAHHVAAGDPEKEPETAVDIQFQAGQRAMYEQAFEEAFVFLDRALDFTLRTGLDVDVELHAAFGEVCAHTGRHERAIEHLEKAAAAVDDPFREAEFHILLAGIHQWEGLDSDAMEHRLRDAATALNFSVFQPLLILLVSTLWHMALGLVVRLTGIGRGSARGQTRRRYELILAMHRQAGHTAFWRLEALRTTLLMLRSLYFNTRLGNGVETVRHNAVISVIAASGNLRGPWDRLSQRAITGAKQLGDLELQGFARLHRYWGQTFLGDQVESGRAQQRYLDEEGRWLRTGEFAQGSADLMGNYYLRGHARKVVEQGTKAMREVRQSGSLGGAALLFLGPVAAARAQLGEFQQAREHLREEQEVITAGDNPFHTAFRAANQVGFCLHTGELDEAIEAIERFQQLDLSVRLTPYYLRDFYVQQCYVWLEILASADDEDRRRRARKQLPEASAELQRARGTHMSLKAHAAVVRGALARIDGDRDGAIAALQFARSLAIEGDVPWARFQAAVETARLYAQTGPPEALHTSIDEALDIATRLGWRPWRRRIEDQFGAVDATSGSSTTSSHRGARSAGGSTNPSDSRSVQLQSYLDAITQVSLAVSEVLSPDNQMRVVLQELISILGAERGLLFLADETTGTLQLELANDAQGNAIDVGKTYSSTVVERVADELEPLIVSRTRQGEELDTESIVTEGIRSIAAAPLVLGDRLVGLVYLDSRLAGGIFRDDDLQILRAIANHIPVALETVRNAQLEAQLESEREQRRLSEALRELVTDMNTTVEIDRILELLAQRLRDFVDFDTARGIVIDDHNRCRQMALYETAENTDQSADKQADTGRWDLNDSPLSQRVFSDAVAVRTQLTDPQRETDPACDPATQSWLGLPLSSRNEVIGMLILESAEPDAFDDSAVQLARTFASQAGVAVENARLITVDELTNISNRRHFFSQASTELQKAHRYDTPLSAIMSDIDHFKEFNDTFGHAAGDEVLRQVAATFRTTIRNVDIVGRYGGEEFAIILPHTDLEAALATAERLRTALDETQLRWDDQSLSVTASFGVAQLQDSDDSVHTLLERADRQLYAAKQRGRNCVMPRN